MPAPTSPAPTSSPVRTAQATAPPRVFAIHLVALLTLGLLVASMIIPRMIIATFGAAALLIVLIPFVCQRRIDWFSPWSFIILAVFFGCTLRGLCMSFGWPDAGRIEDKLVLGADPVDFVYPSILLLLGLGLMAHGFFAASPARGPRRPLEASGWNELRAVAFLSILSICSVVGIQRYVSSTGGVNLNKISAKRATIYDIDIQGDESFNQFGHWRFVSKFSTFAYLILLSYYAHRRRPFGVLASFILACLFLVSAVLPFYSSSRLPILWTIGGTCAILWYARRTNVLKRLIPVVAMGVVLMFVMTLIRNRTEGLYVLTEETTLARIVEGAVIHRNWLGIAKTTHVINAVPEVLERQYGKTIGVWIFAPIPRFAWPDKPMIHSGPIIGTHVFDTRVAGIPPGLLAELYWNFHIPGLLIGSWLFGRLMQYVTWLLHPWRTRNFAHTVLYVLGPMRLGFDSVNNSLGFGITTMVLEMSSVFVILWLLEARNLVTPADRQRSRRGSSRPSGAARPSTVPVSPVPSS